MRIPIDVEITVEVEAWYDTSGGLNCNLCDTGKALKEAVEAALDRESYRETIAMELENG